jgi:hypothetical protein
LHVTMVSMAFAVDGNVPAAILLVRSLQQHVTYLLLQVMKRRD